ncbi:hypothetical protein FQR65_LT02500 [Abscondita terminalis]|nr:hypothetical protein FQR65_LT02500 [Abscondita terminalis]
MPNNAGRLMLLANPNKCERALRLYRYAESRPETCRTPPELCRTRPEIAWSGSKKAERTETKYIVWTCPDEEYYYYHHDLHLQSKQLQQNRLRLLPGNDQAMEKMSKILLVQEQVTPILNAFSEIAVESYGYNPVAVNPDSDTGVKTFSKLLCFCNCSFVKTVPIELYLVILMIPKGTEYYSILCMELTRCVRYEAI